MKHEKNNYKYKGQVTLPVSSPIGKHRKNFYFDILVLLQLLVSRSRGESYLIGKHVEEDLALS